MRIHYKNFVWLTLEKKIRTNICLPYTNTIFFWFTENIIPFVHPLGVAIGAGWQSIVAYVNITTYYLIGIPVGAILGYVFGYHVKVRTLFQMTLLYQSISCASWL